MDQPVSNPNITPGSQPEVKPVGGGEQLPSQSSPESAPAQPEVSAKQPETSVERLSNPEKRSPTQGSVPLPPVQVQPASQSPAATQTQDDHTADDMPLIADDVDVIEMEWVNKAKQIIKQTSNDPHAQEKAVEKLQIDYLKKRYGKDIKSTRS